MKKTIAEPTPTDAGKHPTSNAEHRTSNDGAGRSYPTPAEELINAGRAMGAPVAVTGFAPALIVPEGYKLLALEPAQPPPLLDYIKGSVELSDAESFIAYVKRYQTAETVIFARIPGNSGGEPSFTAVFDYHAAKSAGDENQVRRVAHKAIYPCPLSLSWIAWDMKDGEPQKQLDFVNFIEANAPDVVSPDSATLMEMALNFEARSEVSFASKVERVSGARVLLFNETVDATSRGPAGQMKVPEFLTLRLPVFEGGQVFELKARLEYRPREGRLTIAYRLQRPEDVLRLALKSLREDVAAGTGIVPMTGHLLIGS